jgi:hypothetical protein
MPNLIHYRIIKAAQLRDVTRTSLCNRTSSQFATTHNGRPVDDYANEATKVYETLKFRKRKFEHFIVVVICFMLRY